jgi:hypothetical protein
MPEMQDIFAVYGDGYRKNHGVSITQSKVMNDIMRCRTPRWVLT